MKTPVRTRLLSALLSLVMLVSLLPVSVFAADPASKSAALVTDASTLKAGDQIILSATANDSTFAAGAMSGKFLSSVETKLDALDKKVEIFTLGGSAGAWTLTASDGKKISAVKAKEMSNSGKGTDTWTIAIDDNGAATIASTNTACGRILYNVRNPRFLNYTSDTNVSMLLPSIYKLDTAAARESGIVTDLTTLQNGDKVVVFNPANKKALSSVYNGFYNTGVDVELTGGKLTGYTDAELWTVNRTESGAYTFSTAEGKKLSMDTSYSSTPLDKANVDWELSAAATADCFYIKNVGRGSYLEWFAEKNNWSSYGTIGSNEALFAQQLYLVVAESPEPGQPEDPSAPLKNGDQVVIYNPANLKALSSEYTGFYNKGTDVTDMFDIKVEGTVATATAKPDYLKTLKGMRKGLQLTLLVPFTVNFADGKGAARVREDFGSSTHISTVYDVRELHFTDVAVRLPGEAEHWRVLHHFRWTEEVKFRGTELVRLWPAYYEDDSWRPDDGAPTGRVLYDDAEGNAYAAPCASLTVERYTVTNWFGRTYHLEDISAEFSLPSRGKNRRGYVAYSTEETDGEATYLASRSNYTHQESRLQYPVQTAKDYSGWGDGPVFRRAQSALELSIRDDGSVVLLNFEP